MLIPSRRSGGFSLIELVVIMTIIAILVAIAVPTFSTWATNAKVRATAESLVAAVRQTEATAAARSRVGVFALTNATPTYSATAVASSTSATSWFSILIPVGDETASALGTILTSTLGSQNNVSVVGTSGPLCFNPLGRLAAESSSTTGVGQACTAASTTQTYTVRSNVSAATSKFNVTVTPSGQVRMCDVTKTVSNTNPDGC